MDDEWDEFIEIDYKALHEQLKVDYKLMISDCSDFEFKQPDRANEEEKDYEKTSTYIDNYYDLYYAKCL